MSPISLNILPEFAAPGDVARGDVHGAWGTHVALTTEAYGLHRRRPEAPAQRRRDAGRRRALGLYIVADGMGGHAAGEVAVGARRSRWSRSTSARTRQVLEDLATRPQRRQRGPRPRRWWRWPCSAPAPTSTRWPRPTRPSAAWAPPSCAWCWPGTRRVIGHVGDSRVYLVRNGQCHRLTEDHTLVAAQLKAGTITKEQAATSQYRNVITRAVGIQESVQVDTLIVDLLPGDVFLLCSRRPARLPRPTTRSRRWSADGAATELPKKLIDARQRARRQGQHHRGGGAGAPAPAQAERRAGEAAVAHGGAAEDPALPAPHLQGADGGAVDRHHAHASAAAARSSSRASPARSCSWSSAAGWRSRRTAWRSPSCAPAATSARWGSSTTRRARPRCARPSPPASMVIARADLMNLMKRESDPRGEAALELRAGAVRPPARDRTPSSPRRGRSSPSRRPFSRSPRSRARAPSPSAATRRVAPGLALGACRGGTDAAGGRRLLPTKRRWAACASPFCAPHADGDGGGQGGGRGGDAGARGAGPPTGAAWWTRHIRPCRRFAWERWRWRRPTGASGLPSDRLETASP